MKTEQQIKALAELDGATGIEAGSSVCLWPISMREVLRKLFGSALVGYSDEEKDKLCAPIPPYLTSYDAIIPLIQKQSEHIKTQLADFLGEIALPDYDGTDEFHYSVLHYLICAKPAQLCEALLRATGKWNE